MSAKSSAQPQVQSKGIFNRKFGILAAVIIAFVFFFTIMMYPLIFGPEKATGLVPPSTQIQ